MFEAVTHIWDSLAAPQFWKTLQIGCLAGSGGAGRHGLAKFLMKFLDQYLAAMMEPLPPRGGYASLEEWHRAVLSHYAGWQRKELALAQQYATYLDGRTVVSDK